MNAVVDLFLDFSGEIVSVNINEKKVKYLHEKNRLYLSCKDLNNDNTILISFKSFYSIDKNSTQGLKYYQNLEKRVIII
jgi:hypothetical protein